jgi:hypothetical protein
MNMGMNLIKMERSKKEAVYRRAQSEEHVVPPIPMHMPPLLPWLLTVTLGTSIS